MNTNEVVVVPPETPSTDPHLIWDAESKMLREIAELVKDVPGETTLEKVKWVVSNLKEHQYAAYLVMKDGELFDP